MRNQDQLYIMTLRMASIRTSLESLSMRRICMIKLNLFTKACAPDETLTILALEADFRFLINKLVR